MKIRTLYAAAIMALCFVVTGLTACGGGDTNVTNIYNYLPGCTSTSGVSTTTGQNCDGTGGGGNTEKPSCEMVANPATVAPGGSSEVTITLMNNPITVNVDNGVGTPQDGKFTVTPTADTTYTAQVSNAAGSDICTVTVHVADPTMGPLFDVGPVDNSWAAENFSMSGITGSVVQSYPVAKSNGADAAMADITIITDLNKNNVLDNEDKVNNVEVTLVPQYGATAKARPKSLNLKSMKSSDIRSGMLENGSVTISLPLSQPDANFQIFVQVDCQGQPASVRLHITNVVVTSGSGTVSIDPNGWGPKVNCTQ